LSFDSRFQVVKDLTERLGGFVGTLVFVHPFYLRLSVERVERRRERPVINLTSLIAHSQVSLFEQAFMWPWV
jgi:hypothetical protein